MKNMHYLFEGMTTYSQLQDIFDFSELSLEAILIELTILIVFKYKMSTNEFTLVWRCYCILEICHSYFALLRSFDQSGSIL